MKTCWASSLAILALASGCVDQTPVSWAAADSLDAWMASNPAMVLLDVRSHEEFTAAHLPGAVWVGASPVSQLRAVMPHDAEGIIVTYDAAGEGEMPPVADEAVSVYGFRRVYRLEGGIREWSRSGRRLDGTAVSEFRKRIGG